VVKQGDLAGGRLARTERRGERVVGIDDFAAGGSRDLGTPDEPAKGAFERRFA
jgi:hypothetical protein